MNFKKLLEKLVASNHSHSGNHSNHASSNTSSANDRQLSSILSLPNQTDRTSTDRSLSFGLVKQNIDNNNEIFSHEPASSTNHALTHLAKPSVNKSLSNRYDDEIEITHLGSSCCCSNHFNNPSYCCENNKVVLFYF